jgi:hypothetical protein
MPTVCGVSSWLPDGFNHPQRFDLVTGHHLRPIRASDVALDYPAVMGSRDSLWARYGDAWGWPRADMTFEEDRRDLVRHEREIAGGLSFNYAVFDERERALLGCVYVDPVEGVGDDAADGSRAIVSWWVVDAEVGGPLEAALADAVPAWIDAVWPFTSVRYGV